MHANNLETHVYERWPGFALPPTLSVTACHHDNAGPQGSEQVEATSAKWRTRAKRTAFLCVLFFISPEGKNVKADHSKFHFCSRFSGGPFCCHTGVLANRPSGRGLTEPERQAGKEHPAARLEEKRAKAGKKRERERAGGRAEREKEREGENGTPDMWHGSVDTGTSQGKAFNSL